MPVIRRFRTQPSIETLLEISGIDIVDRTPRFPSTGVGSGALLVVGEFEDGPFAARGDAVEYNRTLLNKGPQEVVGAEEASVYGGFGFTYGTTPSSNPCARRHLFEFWNGSGFIKLANIRTKRLMIARVDTSVGSVAISPRASILGDDGPFALTAGLQLSFTTDLGGPALSTAIAGVEAIAVGLNFAASGFVGGESIKVTVDGGPEVTITFAAGDQTEAQVTAKINLVLGYTAAVNTVGVDMHGLRKGTGGSIRLADGSVGALAAIGMVAATTAGTGNVSNLAAVTAAEIAAIVTATAALIAINVSGSVDSNGALRFQRFGAAGTILVAASTMATTLQLSPIATAITAGEHAAGKIPAGTRVRTAGGLEWVTMQTLSIAAGTNAAPNVGPHVVKVRPATDDGTAVTTALNTVTTLMDQPTFSQMSVTNPIALTAALTEVQMDVAYQAAFDATLDPTKMTREANYSLSARRSDTIDRYGTENAERASSIGFFGRKYISRAPIGFTPAQARADVALHRSDRRFYTYPGWQTNISEIAQRGVAGGAGFTEDGNIVVGGDGPLAMLHCLLNPEENIGQATGLIESFFDTEDVGSILQVEDYIAFKAAGICAPYRDPTDGSVYSEEVTSSLTPGLVTQKRRAMADYIQDSLARLLGPYVKKLATLARRDGARSVIDSFLGLLLSEDNESLQRIAAFLVSEAAQTPDLTALGIFIWQIKVRQLSSMDAITLDTEIGEGVITINEVV